MIETRNHDATVWRRRRCGACGVAFCTAETPQEWPQELRNTSKFRQNRKKSLKTQALADVLRTW